MKTSLRASGAPFSFQGRAGSVRTRILACDERAEEGRRHRLARQLKAKRVNRRHVPPFAVDQGGVRAAADHRRIGDVSGENGLERLGVEHRVQRLDEPSRRAVVALQRNDVSAAVDELALGAKVGVHVGAAEAVDRLLRVADQAKHGARARALEERATEDAPLRLVGVLKFVDERVLPSLAHRVGERAAARTSQRLLDEPQHVVEVVLPVLTLPSRELALDPGQDRVGERRRKRRCRAGEPHGGHADVRGGAGTRRSDREFLEQVLELERVGPQDELRRAAVGARAFHCVGDGLQERPHFLGRVRVHSRALQVGDGRAPARVVEREGLERRVERRHVERGTELAVRLHASPQEVLDVGDGPAGAEGRLEPARADRIAGDVASERLAHRAPERVAAVDVLLVEQATARKGVLAEHALAKPVDRGNRGGVERMKRSLDAFARAAVERPEVAAALVLRRRGLSAAREELLELAPEASAKLVGGLLGERHDEHAVQRDLGGQEKLDDDLLQRERLAGARRRFDDGVPIERDVPEDARPGHSRGAHGVSRRLANSGPNRRAIIACARSSVGNGYSWVRGTGPYAERSDNGPLLSRILSRAFRSHDATGPPGSVR